MFLSTLGFLFHIEMITDVCTFTRAAQSLRLGEGRGGKGGDVFKHNSVCKGPVHPRSAWPGEVLPTQLPCPGVQTSHFILRLSSVEAIIHFWFALVKRAERSCKRHHPCLKSTAPGLG